MDGNTDQQTKLTILTFMTEEDHNERTNFLEDKYDLDNKKIGTKEHEHIHNVKIWSGLQIHICTKILSKLQI